jgi:hypothetical protein
MKIIYQGRVWEEGDTPSLEVGDVCNVPDEELTDLLSQILTTFQARKHMDTAIKVIKDRTGLVAPEEAAAISKLKLKSTSLYYLNNYSLSELSIEGKIPEYKLHEMDPERTAFFACVELPPNLKKQLNAFGEKQAEERKKASEKKKERQIKKAKKLLESLKIDS